jgi:hypothetical protein
MRTAASCSRQAVLGDCASALPPISAFAHFFALVHFFDVDVAEFSLARWLLCVCLARPPHWATQGSRRPAPAHVTRHGQQKSPTIAAGHALATTASASASARAKKPKSPPPPTRRCPHARSQGSYPRYLAPQSLCDLSAAPFRSLPLLNRPFPADPPCSRQNRARAQNSPPSIDAFPTPPPLCYR